MRILIQKLNTMTIEEAIRLLPRGKCILFTGSGFSFGAKNAHKDSSGKFCDVRSAYDIMMDLAAMAGIADEKNLNLGDVADYCRKNIPLGNLINFLKKEFSVTDVSDDHLAIGSIEWRRCYTTNYDEILEIAHKKNGRPISSITINTREKDAGKSKGACIHLNGVISNLSEGTLDNEFKFTHRSYLVDEFTASDWFGRFKEDLLNADAVFFIGFSGDYDLDIKRVFESTKELREKSFFIIGTDSGKLSISKLKEFGNVHPIGLDGFVKKFREISNEFESVPNNVTLPLSFKCFRRVDGDDEGGRIGVNAIDVINLLSHGEIDPVVLNRSVREPNDFRYFIYRNKIDYVILRIAEGYKYFLVTSSLGNGKSLFAEGLAVKLSRAGFQVFFFDKEREFVFDEVEQICNDYEKPVIVVDNYVQYTQLVKKISKRLTDNTVLILTERTSRYEMSSDFLDFLDDDPYAISLDKLDDTERESIVRLFDKYGLWGDKAALSFRDKKNFIRDNCKNCFCDLLLNRLEANQLKKSYNGIISAIKDKEQYYKAILLILFSNFFGFKLEYGSLIESMAGNVLNNPSFKSNHNIKELINFEEEKITFRSSILAKHILSKHIDKEDFKEYYIALFNELDRKSKGNKIVRNALKEMMKHSNLYKFFGNNRSIYSIYDNISDCQFTQSHPLFWLQYAIAKTSDRQFHDARRHFDTSYALAKAIDNYNTFQIDNHYARFLLSGALHGDELDADDAFSVFREAHDKLMTERKGDEFRHYIYSVANDYEPFWRKYSKSFSPEEIVEYKECCRKIADKAESYLERPGTANREVVKRTLKGLKNVISGTV